MKQPINDNQGDIDALDAHLRRLRNIEGVDWSRLHREITDRLDDASLSLDDEKLDELLRNSTRDLPIDWDRLARTTLPPTSDRQFSRKLRPVSRWVKTGLAAAASISLVVLIWGSSERPADPQVSVEISAPEGPDVSIEVAETPVATSVESSSTVLVWVGTDYSRSSDREDAVGEGAWIF
jgi:hypothetical protein